MKFLIVVPSLLHILIPHDKSFVVCSFRFFILLVLITKDKEIIEVQKGIIDVQKYEHDW